MRRSAVLIGIVLVLGACGSPQNAADSIELDALPKAEREVATGSDVAAEAVVAPTPPDDVFEDDPYETPPSDALSLDDFPPIRTGPMAANDLSPRDGELAAERQAQLNLPRADHPLWNTLRQTRISIDESSQLFTASHPAPVRAMAGRRVTVRGYMLPLEATDQTRHFLISPYTPVCFFHPPAEPNEVIEVRLSRPIEAGYHLVEVSGVLRLANDGEKGLFFVIANGSARIIERVLA